MLKINCRLRKLKVYATTLFATLFIVIASQLPLHAGTNPLHFDRDAIKDPGSLVVKLQDPQARVSEFIASQLSEDMQWALIGYDGTSEPSPQLQKLLQTDLNRLLEAGTLYDAQRFADIELSEQTKALLAQSPQSGDALVRLNRFLLADTYPYELASLSDEQTAKDFKGIEACRENLRQIKMARDTYRTTHADLDPEWLSELVPQYLDEKLLRCPADATAGDPGVLTEGASDPNLPCSYLYEIRPSEKNDQQMLWPQEGGMIPIVRCEHHRLNLSLSGKLYRNGPQRDIYDSNRLGFSALADVVRGLRKQHGKAFLKTQEGRAHLKQVTEELILKKFAPKLLSFLETEVVSQIEAQLGKGILNTPMGIQILQQAMPQMKSQIEERLQSQLQAQLGEAFFETQEGKDILRQLSALLSP